MYSTLTEGGIGSLLGFGAREVFSKRCAFLTVVVALNCSTLLHAAQYSFSRVYTGTVDPGVAINDNGLVAISDGYLLFTTTDGQSKTMVAGSTSWNSLGKFNTSQILSLNNNGFVAFRGYASGSPYGVFASNGTTTREIAVSTSIWALRNVGAMSINDSGMVAFSAPETSDSVFPIFVGDGLTNATDTGCNGSVPAINNAGTIAYRYYDSGTSQETIKIQKGIQTFLLPGSPVTYAMPDINELGVAAFEATVDGMKKIVIGDGIMQTTYIDGSAYKGGLSSGWVMDDGAFDCAINNQGLVAFGACVTSQGVDYGVFTGADPTKDKVIMEGDELFGATIKSQSLIFSRNGLNNKGQIAFTATLSDGTSGVFVATPIPEPSALILIVIGVLCSLGYVWRSRRREA